MDVLGIKTCFYLNSAQFSVESRSTERFTSQGNCDKIIYLGFRDLPVFERPAEDTQETAC